MWALENILQCPVVLEESDDRTFDPLLVCRAFHALKKGDNAKAFRLADASLKQYPYEGVSYTGLPVGIIAAQNQEKRDIAELWLARFLLILDWDTEADLCDTRLDFTLTSEAAKALPDRDFDHLVGRIICSGGADAVGRLNQTTNGRKKLASLKSLAVMLHKHLDQAIKPPLRQ